jgi:hypothetical protein
VAPSLRGGAPIKVKVHEYADAVAPFERYRSAGGVRPGQPHDLEIQKGAETKRYRVMLQLEQRYTIELDGPPLAIRLILDK